MPAYTAVVERNGETFRAIVIHSSTDPAKAAAYARRIWWDADDIRFEEHSDGHLNRRRKENKGQAD